MGIKLGDTISGIRISIVHCFDGEILSYGNTETTFWFQSVLDKYIPNIKQVIETWERRKKERRTDKEKAYCEWHLEYNREHLQELIATSNALNKN